MALADDARRRTARIRRLHAASTRFVPAEFLKLLGRDELSDVVRGDQVSRTMTVYFSDIRSFTTMSEKMTPEQTLTFINEYLDVVEPVIRANRGGIDKYIGDAVMALFDRAEDAVQAALQTRSALAKLNEVRTRRGEIPIEVGVGIHTGPLVLGTVGSGDRLSCTVLGDTVNVASRLEGLTRQYAEPVLISEATVHALADQAAFDLLRRGSVKAKGKEAETTLYGVRPVSEHPAGDARPERP